MLQCLAANGAVTEPLNEEFADEGVLLADRRK